jgi:electron transport complex protein RnfC
MPVPEKVELPLQDHPGDSYELLVATGDYVRGGQKIGTMGIKPQYLAVHTPCAGRVSAIEHRVHEGGGERRVLAVEITAIADQECEQEEPFSRLRGDWSGFLREKGVPLDYEALTGARALVVNCTEFEPTISTRFEILQSHGEAFAGGLRHLIQATGLSEVTLLANRADTVLRESLRAIAKRVSGVRVKTVHRDYPDTLQPLMSFRRRLNGTPAPAVILGPGQVLAIYNAIELGQPFIRQLVSVAGSGVPVPHNIWVYAGTALGDVLKYAGVAFPFAGRVALGGPMMGGPRYSLETGIGRRVRGLYAAAGLFLADERKSRFYQSCACIRCGKCADVCPAGLNPIAIAEQVKFLEWDRALELGLLSCLECGLCVYVCPSQLPLVEMIKLGKLQTKGRESLLIYNIFKTLSS